MTAVPAVGGAEGYALADTLTKLEGLRQRTPSPSPLPHALLVSDIKTLPDLFQPRCGSTLDERHLEDLKGGLKISRRFDAVLILWIGGVAYLVDGHHRLEAYRRAKRTTPIPIENFTGTVLEAVYAAGRGNSRAKLPMSNTQRQDYAWRLVCLGGGSKRDIRDASGVSDGQIGTMRRVLKRLGGSAADCERWREAERMSKGGTHQDIPEEQREAWLEALGQKHALRIRKACGNKLATNVTVGARALSIYFGGVLPELLGELQGYLPEGLPAINEDF